MYLFIYFQFIEPTYRQSRGDSYNYGICKHNSKVNRSQDVEEGGGKNRWKNRFTNVFTYLVES